MYLFFSSIKNIMFKDKYKSVELKEEKLLPGGFD